MIKRLSSLSLLSIMAAFMVALTGAGIRAIQAAPENTFEVHLIWGTDGERAKDKPLKDVEPKLKS